jgi:hypothetical protein
MLTIADEVIEMNIRRRAFIATLGTVVAAPRLQPRIARAQQRTRPVIGFLGNDSPVTNVEWMRAFHQGLKEAGYVEGDNVTILYRWGEAHPDRLPELAADLVRRRVAVLASFGTASALAAKAATATIPVVFAVSQEPVRLGLSGREPGAAGRQRHRLQLSVSRAGVEAAGTSARAGAGCCQSRRPRRPGRSPGPDDYSRRLRVRYTRAAAN